MAHVEVDQSRCMGSGYCVLEAPDLFVLDEDGLSVPTVPDPATVEDRGSAQRAAAACPLQAITYSNDQGDSA